MLSSIKYYRDTVLSNIEEKICESNFLLSHSSTDAILHILKVRSNPRSILFLPDFYCGETTNTIRVNWPGEIVFFNFNPLNPSKGILEKLYSVTEKDIFIVPIIWRFDEKLLEIFRIKRVQLIIDAAQFYRFSLNTLHPVVFSDYKYLNLRVGGSFLSTTDPVAGLAPGELRLIGMHDIRYFFSSIFKRLNLKKIHSPLIQTTYNYRKSGEMKHTLYSLYRYNREIGKNDFNWRIARLKRNKFLNVLIEKKCLFNDNIIEYYKSILEQEEVPISIPLLFNNTETKERFLKFCKDLNFEVFYWPDISAYNMNLNLEPVLCISIIGNERLMEIEYFRKIFDKL